MNKNKNNLWSGIDRDDLWMGLAFMMASRSSTGNACLLVESDNLLYVGLEAAPKYSCTSKFTIPAEIDAIMNCTAPYTHAALFLTTTPSPAGLLCLASLSKVQRLVYFEKTKGNIDEELAETLVIQKFKGNLNWLRDYVRSLDFLDSKS